MLLRASIMTAVAVTLVATAAQAEAGSFKRAVTPVSKSPGHVHLVPMNPPLAGVFLTSREPECATRSVSGVRTTFYFDGRWEERPDFFYIVRDGHKKRR